jgi:hypothetical protein
MFDSISAPASINPMVTQLNALSASLEDEFVALGAAYKRLLASGATGAAIDALGMTLARRQNLGSLAADTTRGVATASSNFKQDVDSMDASFAARLGEV